MPLTVLTDDDVRTLLHSLDRSSIVKLQQSLADALHYYSAGEDDENSSCGAGYQPPRTQIKCKNGSTTLFMPGSSTDGMGIKVVTVSESSSTPYRPPAFGSIDSTASSMSSVTIGSPSSGLSRSSTAAASDVPSYPRSETPPSSIRTEPANTSPHGSLTLLDKQGDARAFINAAEITAFRTALASTMLFNKRQNVHDVVIFGAGKQAYWHARLALILRGEDVHHLNIINRSFDSGVELVKALFKTPWPVSVPHPAAEIVTPGHNEYARHLKSLIRTSSVIFCTTPSLTPLFPPEILTSTEGRKKGRYVAAIGSYKPHMCEIHPDIIRQAVAPSHHHHHHKHAKQGGAIVVDSVEACLKEAGELIQAGIGGKEVVELGELVMLKRDAERRKEQKKAESDESLGEVVQLGRKKKKGGTEEGDGGLKDWLERGNVVYKSVGLGLMDCVVGNELVKLADERGIGTRFENF